MYEQGLREAREDLGALLLGVNEVGIGVDVIDQTLLILRHAEEVRRLTDMRIRVRSRKVKK